MKQYNLSPEEEKTLIENQFNEILNFYMSSNHRKKKDIIIKAFNFAKNAHKDQRRRSGEPYIFHPLAVARIICIDMGLGSTSIVAALLHDIVEDTEYTAEDIETLFGPKVTQIILGVTKLKDGMFEDNPSQSEQEEAFRNLFIVMTKDIRTILIKLADRLHNMRTISVMSTKNKMIKSGETINMYAPIAYKLGLFSIKTELEELAFASEHPQQYEILKNKIEESSTQQLEIFNEFISTIEAHLKALNIDYTIKKRIKPIYSIWKKMKRDQLSFEEVFDLYAVRIIFTPTSDENENDICWKIFSRISYAFPRNNERTRDWISTPKSNGYKALHLTVLGPLQQWIEVQIRSQKMDQIAEMGLAAHWKYKTGDHFQSPEIEKWLNQIRETLENPNPSSMDFLDTIQGNIYTDEIITYTPAKDTIILPRNASVLDFAYHVHEKIIGPHCIAAHINGQLAPWSATLNNGDLVKIITNKEKFPQEEWLDHVITKRAKTSIRKYFKELYEEQVKEGEKIIRTLLKEKDIESNDENLLLLSKYFNKKSLNEFFSSIAKNEIDLSVELKSLIEDIKNISQTANNKNSEEIDPTIIDKKKPYVLKKNAFYQNYITSTCCSPILGDNTVGFIKNKNEVYLHQRSCEVATKLKCKGKKNIVETEWGEHPNILFEVSLKIKGIDSAGILKAIVNYISTDINISISEIKLSSANGIFGGTIKVLARNRDDINRLCKELPRNPHINSVVRL